MNNREVAIFLIEGRRIPKKNKGGDCFQVAANLATDFGSENLVLVHGIVTGQGPIEGIQYSHAWVEDGDQVIDKSNGRDIKLDKHLYYFVGRIEYTVRYTSDEAREMLLKTENYGPWDEKILAIQH